MRGLRQVNNNREDRGSDARQADLFFKALFRLGVWPGDWDTWYGTKPLAAWITEQHARVVPPSNPLDRPSG